ncbi:MAG: hypothetical protein ACK4RN_13935 [Pseudorhodobacter sp.]
MMRFLVALIMAFLPLTAQAQNLPKFDGVYVGLGDGSFEKLPRLDFVYYSLCELPAPSREKANNSGIRYVSVPMFPQFVQQFRFLEDEVFSSLPSFKMGTLDSLLVKGGDEKIEFVYQILWSDQFFERGVYADGKIYRLSRDVNKSERSCADAVSSDKHDHWGVQGSKLPVEYRLPKNVSSSCGWNDGRFNILSDFPNALQYFPKNVGTVRTFIYEDAFNACGIQRNQKARAVGRVVVTNKGFYAYRLE